MMPRPVIPFIAVIRAAASQNGLQAELVAAICFQESRFDPLAERHEPKFQSTYIDSNPKYSRLPEPTRRQLATSLGIMQVMGVVATEFGLPVSALGSLCDPVIGLDYGCRKLRSLIKKHKTIEEAIAAYNAGSPRRMADGTFVNQTYVDRVNAKRREFRVKW